MAADHKQNAVERATPESLERARAAQAGSAKRPRDAPPASVEPDEAERIDGAAVPRSSQRPCISARCRRLRLLHDALDRTGRAGLARFTCHNREYLATIRSLDGVLALHTMGFADELVPGGEIDFDAPARGPSDREVQIAGKLVSLLHEDFDPAKRKDDAVLDMINRKAAGKKPRTSIRRAPRSPRSRM